MENITQSKEYGKDKLKFLRALTFLLITLVAFLNQLIFIAKKDITYPLKRGYYEKLIVYIVIAVYG